MLSNVLFDARLADQRLLGCLADVRHGGSKQPRG